MFVDSLDQLSNEDQGRSDISFLKGVKPHQNTRIIVSSLPDDENYTYYCDLKLRNSNVPRVVVEMTDVSNMSALDESMSIIDELLSRKNRTLTEEQRLVVRDRVSMEREKTALYINLAVQVISRWTSQVDASQNLEGGVRNLITQVFKKLEHDYGDKLVKFALAFMTFSKKGISDVEMEELLSLDDEILDFVFQYHENPAIRRVPSHVWLRLKNAIRGFIVEGEAGCSRWYHRQLREVAEDYFKDERSIAVDHMSQYFGNLVSRDVLNEKKLRSQPRVLNNTSCASKNAIINTRRCDEAFHHMIERKRIIEAIEEMCSTEAVYANVRYSTTQCFDYFKAIVKLADLVDQNANELTED